MLAFIEAGLDGVFLGYSITSLQVILATSSTVSQYSSDELY